MPRGMRFSSLEDRRSFYAREFSTKKVAKWLGGRQNTVFALIVGRHTGIYPPEYEKIKKNTVVVDNCKDLEDLREYILQYLPEGVYYDRNLYEDINACEKCGKSYRDCWDCEGFLGQELAFDVDPENIRCPWHGSVREKMKRGQGLSFCMHEFNAAKRQALALYRELEKEYEKLKVVYSGRGFHIHVGDERARGMGRKERKKVARKMMMRYAIDEWVTSGEMRLIRLPYSLNGLVSRICLPLKYDEVARFDPRKDKRCRPGFLRAISSAP